MLSNFFSRINQKWNEFLYGPVCSWLNEIFFEDGHIVIESNKPQEHQNINEYIGTSLSEIVTKFREQPIKLLESIDYSPEKFAEFITLKTKRDEIIKHYEEEVLPTLKGNAAKKMDDFIKHYKKAEKVAPDDRTLPEKELDMNKGKIIEEPSKEMQGANITAHNPKTLFGFIGRFLG